MRDASLPLQWQDGRYTRLQRDGDTLLFTVPVRAGDAALRRFADEVGADPGLPILWPEHLDLAITIDGVSLTVNTLPRAGVVQVSLVPFTREHTTLGDVKVGDRVHVEADVLGKYVRQLCRSER